MMAEVTRYMPSYLPAVIVVNDDVIRTVQHSWKRALSGKTEAFAAVQVELVARGESYRAKPDVAFHTIFYGRLFELIPEVRPKFRAGGMQDQGNLFTRMFDFAVREFYGAAAQSPDNSFKTELRRLALFHNRLGVIPYDYAAMGQALFYGLHRFLGAEYTREVELAWLYFYGAMMEAVIPHVVSGGKLDQAETLQFIKALKEAYKDPCGADVPDLRTLENKISLTASESAIRLSTLGRHITEDERHEATGLLSRLPRADKPNTVTVPCQCGALLRLPVPLVVVTQIVTGEVKHQTLPAFPPASASGASDHQRAPGEKRGRKPLGLDMPGHQPLDSQTSRPENCTPKATGEGTSSNESGSTLIRLSCPQCLVEQQMTVPVQFSKGAATTRK